MCISSIYRLGQSTLSRRKHDRPEYQKGLRPESYKVLLAAIVSKLKHNGCLAGYTIGRERKPLAKRFRDVLEKGDRTIFTYIEPVIQPHWKPKPEIVGEQINKRLPFTCCWPMLKMFKGSASNFQGV